MGCGASVEVNKTAKSPIKSKNVPVSKPKISLPDIFTFIDMPAITEKD